MDFTATRPVAYSPPTTGHRPSLQANAPTLATDVPANKAVSPSPKAETFKDPVEHSDEADRQKIETIKRDDFLDPETKSLVYKAVIETTGEVVAQIPDETILRLRRAIAETTAVNLTGIGFDRKL